MAAEPGARLSTMGASAVPSCPASLCPSSYVPGSTHPTCPARSVRSAMPIVRHAPRMLRPAFASSPAIET